MFYIVLLITIPYLFIRLKKSLHMLQQNFYNENNRYVKWCLKNFNQVITWFDLFIIVINLINLKLRMKFLLLLNILYIVVFLWNKKKDDSQSIKIPLKVTSRIKRLFVTNVLVIAIFVILLIRNTNDVYLSILLYTVILSCIFIIDYLANIINVPVEKLVFLSYKSKAKKRLKKQNMDVIGITGSYGKTSSKNILNDILSVKYNVLKTPKNYNTQYGLMLTINNYMDKFNDVFIAEMGAFKKGRIKKLCQFVKPKYGIITKIGKAHLETFGTIKNIQEGKFELVESLPKDGLAILNMDDELQVNYELKNSCNVLWIAIHNDKADLVANDIKVDAKGMHFNVYFKEEKKAYAFETKLLGEANIYNILQALAFAKHLGMSYEDMQLGVKCIKPVEHRLELKKVGNKTIIDDAYNSNPVGANMALDVLNLMDGYKVVVTPGMIELGEEQYEQNKMFGKHIASVADYVILVGKKQTKPLYDGLLEEKYDKTKIQVINDVKEAFIILDTLKTKKDMYVLLENDLPDIFNEKE